MIWQRAKRTVIPVLVMFALAFLGLTISLAASQKVYQSRNYREMSNLIGLIAETYPELDTAEIIQVLQGREVANSQITNQLGTEILQKYGVSEKYFATQSAADMTLQVGLAAVAFLSFLALIVGVYFWWRDWRLARQVEDLVSYMRELGDRIYDLRLEENSEDELSILSNELYKITVLLRETAENHQKLAENLETAIADISHQLKTPLTSLQIMIDEIYEDPKMPEKVRQDFLRLMSQQVQSMSTLATTLLNLARLDNGTFKMHDKTFQVNELFNQVRQKLEILADLNDVELDFLGDRQAEIKLDLRWQTEALSNVVKNAIEHSQPGQKVKIKAEDCPLFLKIVVEDAGSGMSAHDMRHVFERFYRVPNPQQNSDHMSVGIGLAFAKAIIEADRGQITVDSELGKGAKFTIRYFR